MKRFYMRVIKDIPKLLNCYLGWMTCAQKTIGLFALACFRGHLKIVEFLSHFLTVDDMCANNNEAFRIACHYEHLKIVEFLSPFLTVNDMRAENNEAFRRRIFFKKKFFFYKKNQNFFFKRVHSSFFEASWRYLCWTNWISKTSRC